MTVEAAHVRECRLAGHAAHVINPVCLPQPEPDPGQGHNDEQEHDVTRLHRPPFAPPWSASTRVSLGTATPTARGRWLCGE